MSAYPKNRRMPHTTEERFFMKVAISEGCWEWIGAHDGHGYGHFWFNGRTGKAHRYSYELYRGAIPDGLTIDHLCRNKLCVNPDHLEAVTMGVNAERAGGLRLAWDNRKSKTHCVNGHEFTPENTYTTAKQRHCLACRREAEARYNAKRRTK